MEAGCYTLDLYCDTPDNDPDPGKRIHPFLWFPRQFINEYGSECRRKARETGWVFHRDGTLTCPICNGKMTREEAENRKGH